MAKSTKPKQQLEITPVSEWLDDYEVVKLPSGKVVGLRQVDVLSLLTADGDIPSVLMPIVTGHMTSNPSNNGNVEMDIKDLKPLNQLLERLTRACFVNPPIVDSMDEVKAGKGIHIDMVPYTDKVMLIAWNMGGQERVDAATMFLEEQGAGLDDLQSSNGVSPASEPDSESA